jgi:hypothetical protein
MLTRAVETKLTRGDTVKARQKPPRSRNHKVPAFENAAIKVLRVHKRPLSVREIADEIAHQGLVTVRGKTPLKTLQATISRNESRRARYGQPAIFHRIVDGRFVRFTLKSK